MNNFFLTALLPIKKEHPLHVLPNRNFVSFNGKPMYQFMIEKLLRVSKFENIVITTDSDEVKEYCKSNGKLRILDLPKSLTGEDVKSDMVTRHTIEKISGEYFIEFQSFNPLVSNHTINEFIDIYMQFVVPGEYFDCSYSIQRRELRNYDIDKRELNDDYPFVIFENGIFHGFTRSVFKQNKNKKIGKMPMITDVRNIENILVDSNNNYELAKLIYANRDKFPDLFHERD